jgi:hypothetical protein
MCDAKDAIALALERCIAAPVPFERCTRAVELVPVELDNEPPIVPHGIDLATGDEGVHRRRTQASLPAEVEKSPLELGTGQRRISIVLQYGTQQGQARPPSVASGDPLDRAKVEAPAPLGFLDCTLELPKLAKCSKIQESTS